MNSTQTTRHDILKAADFETRTAAAEAFGWSRRTLYRWLDEENATTGKLARQAQLALESRGVSVTIAQVMGLEPLPAKPSRSEVA